MSNSLAIYNSPSLTRTHKMNDQTDKISTDHEVLEIVDPQKRNHDNENKDIASPRTKKQRLVTPDGTLNSTPSPYEEINEASPTKALTKKQLERLERQKQRDIEKVEKEKRKEEERLLKEEERKTKEEERRRKANEKEIEKEIKRKKFDDEKLERERKKEEERLKKSTEKEEREKQRLEKKRKNEELKERKELEKKKTEELKERSQMKISNFFTIGPKITKSPTKIDSKTETNAVDLCSQEEGEDEIDVYHKVFLPFFQKKNVIMAPSIQLSDLELRDSMDGFDSIVNAANNKHTSHADMTNFFRSHKPMSRERNHTFPQDIVNALNSSQTIESQIYEMFQNLLPMKYLQFYENTKPPYIGTWSSSIHTSITLPVRNPFDTTKSGLDYSYDSDAEWNGDDAEEEGEGEDIDNDDDDEDDEDVDDEEEMDDFVEGNDLMKKKKRIMGPLVAISKWNNNEENNFEFFDKIKYERLDVNIEFSIDPFTDYWNTSTKEKVDGPYALTSTNLTNLTESLETSPRKSNSRITNVLTPQKPTIKDPKAIHELVQFIEKNNDFTIGTLVELSKKEFKTFTKALLKHTIQDIAIYNKKCGNWVVKPGLKEKLSIGSEK